MICLNPNCGKEAHVEEDAIICDRCGTAMPVEAYSAMYNYYVNTGSVAVKSTVGFTEMSYRDRVDRMVAAQLEGWAANPHQSLQWSTLHAFEIAVGVIDAIDKAIAEREKA